MRRFRIIIEADSILKEKNIFLIYLITQQGKKCQNAIVVIKIIIYSKLVDKFNNIKKSFVI